MRAILFDLDGTLLPMDLKKFEQLYFHSLSNYFKDLVDKDHLIKSVWMSTNKMLTDESNSINRQVFEKEFTNHVSDLDLYMDRFEKYYETDFNIVKASTSMEPLVRDIIDILKDKGYIIVLATNPLFPLKAVEERIKWAGLKKSDFHYISHFENSIACKPRSFYYENILNELSLTSSDCIMIGNDVSDDMKAKDVGLKTFLLTPHILNESVADPNWDYQGDYNDLFNWANSLPTLE